MSSKENLVSKLVGEKKAEKSKNSERKYIQQTNSHDHILTSRSLRQTQLQVNPEKRIKRSKIKQHRHKIIKTNHTQKKNHTAMF